VHETIYILGTAGDALEWVFSEWRMQIENPSDVGRLFVFPPMKAGKHYAQRNSS
jgi:hypothetical protein